MSGQGSEFDPWAGPCPLIPGSWALSANGLIGRFMWARPRKADKAQELADKAQDLADKAKGLLGLGLPSLDFSVRALGFRG